MELLPWDCRGILHAETVADEDLILLDRAAALTLADNCAFAEMRPLYETEKRLCVSSFIDSYRDGQPQKVDIQAKEIFQVSPATT